MPDGQDDIVDAAAAQFARLQSHAVTDDIRQEIEGWRKQDAAHAAALDSVSETWSMLALLAEAREITALTAQVVDRNPPRHPAEPHVRSRRHWIAMAAGVAGLLALPAAYFALFGHATPLLPTQQVAGATGPATLTLTAPNGRKRQLVLPDGSRVLLDAASTIELAYSPERRALRLLKGRAFFQVKKDKTRPFSVETGYLTAIAVGTAFDVRRFDTGADVTTTEGLVQVKARRSGSVAPVTTLVPAGTHLSYTGTSLRVAQVDVGKVTSWHEGKLVFASRCLASAAADFNAYSTRKLTVTTDAAKLAISGVFEADNVDAFMHTLEEQGFVKITILESGIMFSRGEAANLPLCTS